MTKKQLTEQEINKTIAEFEFGEQEIHIDNKSIATNFMYDDTIGDKYPATIKKTYTESLDSLVPVWEKLERDFEMFMVADMRAKKDSIYFECSRATARVIQDLQDEQAKKD